MCGKSLAKSRSLDKDREKKSPNVKEAAVHCYTQQFLGIHITGDAFPSLVTERLYSV